LGQGGFGQVWSVCFKRCLRAKNHDPCVAMKFVRRSDRFSPHHFASALKREKACLTAFTGGPFVQMYGFAGDDDMAYFLMEEAEGGDASKTGSLFSKPNGHLIRGGSTLHRKDVALLLHDLVDGLQRLHSRGVVHRDVKSANLFLTAPCGAGSQCRGKLSDFGLACGTDSLENAMLTKALQRCDDIVGGGTRSWWSPEHNSDSSPSTKLDIWGAGLVLYQLTFGEWPGVYVRDQGKSALARSIQEFRIQDDKNFRQLNRRAEALGPLLGTYYSMLGRLMQSMLEFEPGNRADSEGLLESAKQLVAVCGASTHRHHHHSGEQELVDCIESSSPGTSVSASLSR